MFSKDSGTYPILQGMKLVSCCHFNTVTTHNDRSGYKTEQISQQYVFHIIFASSRMTTTAKDTKLL